VSFLCFFETFLRIFIVVYYEGAVFIVGDES
jgi:hypothetical protein